MVEKVRHEYTDRDQIFEMMRVSWGRPAIERVDAEVEGMEYEPRCMCICNGAGNGCGV